MSRRPFPPLTSQASLDQEKARLNREKVLEWIEDILGVLALFGTPVIILWGAYLLGWGV